MVYVHFLRDVFRGFGFFGFISPLWQGYKHFVEEETASLQGEGDGCAACPYEGGCAVFPFPLAQREGFGEYGCSVGGCELEGCSVA